MQHTNRRKHSASFKIISSQKHNSRREFFTLITYKELNVKNDKIAYLFIYYSCIHKYKKIFHSDCSLNYLIAGVELFSFAWQRKKNMFCVRLWRKEINEGEYAIN